MLIAANTRWPATASRVFELIEMVFIEIIITKCMEAGFSQIRSHILYCSYLENRLLINSFCWIHCEVVESM